MLPKIATHKPFRSWAVVLAAVAVLVLAACTGIQPVVAPPPEAAAQPMAGAAIPEITIQVSDSGITVPEVVPGGIVGIAIENTGTQTHAVDLWRIREGHTRDEITAMNEYLQENPDDFFGVFELGSWIHYAQDIAPGATAHYYADLRTGDFFVTDDTNPDLAPVFFAATELAGTTEPEAAVTVDMVDFAYAMPDTVPAGKQLWEFTNSGEQWHLAAIATHNPDASPDEILASFGGENTPPPADAVVQILGGLPPMSPGERVWMEIELAPGSYELLCPLPDVAALATGDEPLPHLIHGMRHAFTVAN